MTKAEFRENVGNAKDRFLAQAPQADAPEKVCHSHSGLKSRFISNSLFLHLFLPFFRRQKCDSRGPGLGDRSGTSQSKPKSEDSSTLLHFQRARSRSAAN